MQLAQSHTTGEWGYWDLNPDSLDLESLLFTTTSHSHRGPVPPGDPLGSFCATLVNGALVSFGLVASSCAPISWRFRVWVEFAGQLEVVGCARTVGWSSVLVLGGLS